MTDTLWQLGGWTMVHFLWLGTGVALVGATLRFACRRAAPNVRYATSLITFVALATTPIAIAAWLTVNADVTPLLQPRALPGGSATIEHERTPTPGQSPGLQTAAPRVIDLAVTEVAPSPRRATDRTANPSPSPSLQGRGTSVDAIVTHLPWVWLIGAPLTFALLASGLVGSERLRRKCTALTEGPAAAACEQLRQAMQITRRVSVAVCDKIAQPVLIGILRPLILLPASALSGWTPAELEMVLVHELAHVRRWDNFINLVQRIIESALFFHPAVWLVSRQVRRDREECCDAVVVSRIERPHDYAALLVSIAAKMQSRRPAALAAASAMADHPLTGRVRRILKLEDEPMWISRRTLGLTLALPLLLIAAVIYSGAAAQDPEASPTKEAAPQPDYYGGPPKVGGEGTAVEFLPDTDADVIRKAQEELERSGKKVTLEINADGRKRLVYVPAPTEADDDEPNPQIDPEIELPRLMHEIKRLEDRIAEANKDLVNVEIFRQLALGSARSPALVEQAVAEALDKDPMIASYQSDLFMINKAIQLRQANSRNPNDKELKKLQGQAQQTELMMQQHRNQMEKSAREQIAKMPNEAYRAAIVEHKIRYEAAMANLKKYHDELSEANRKLDELVRSNSAGKETDEPIYAVAYPVADVETIDFQRWMQLISSDKRIDVRWFDENKSLVVNAPKSGHERISELLSETRDKSGDPGVEERIGYAADETPFSNALARRTAPAIAEDAATTSQQEINWRNSLDEAKAEALKTGKLLFVYFHAKSSEPCRTFEQSVLLASDVRSYIDDKFIPVKIDVDAPPAMTAAFRIFQIPRTIVATSGGETLAQIGPNKPAFFLASLMEVSDKEHLPPNATVVVPDDGTVLIAPPKSTKPADSTAPSPLAPGDEVKIRVVGAFPEWPLDEVFRIEEEGTLALGPAYGRVAVAGQTLAEAEKTLLSHLSKILSDVEVQLTLHQRAASAPLGGGKATYLYDGKPFDEWQNLWKHELNTERRTEAIEAFAAFARAGYGKQAAETILDVAGEYDFSHHWTGETSPEAPLRKAIAAALDPHGNIPATIWLPLIRERIAKNPQQWLPVLEVIFASVGQVDPTTRDALLEMASDKGPSAAYLRVLHSAGLRDEPKVQELTKAALTGDDGDNAIRMLEYVDLMNLDDAPERLAPFFHKDPEIRRRARTHLAGSSFNPAAIATDALRVLEDPQRSGDHADALRLVSAMRMSHRGMETSLTNISKILDDRLERLLMEGPPELLPAALVASGRPSSEAVEQWLDSRKDWVTGERRALLLDAADELEKEIQQVAEPQFRGGGMGGGGGFF